MHISDGVLPPEIIATGFAVTTASVVLTSRKLDTEDIPKISLFTAVFFVASLIHFPVPPTSVHLILNGLLGIILGRKAFIAITVGLFFQSIMFQHGGILALGVNAFNLAMPAVLMYYIFRLSAKKFNDKPVIMSLIAGVLCFLAVIISAVLLLLELLYSGEGFNFIVKALFTGSLITAGIEGIITFSVVRILYKTKPGLLNL